MSARLLPSRESLPLLVIDEATRSTGVLEGRTKLMKLVFLGQRLAPKAMGLPGGMLALYRFEPHNFGPFSPEVLSDLEDLESKGLIEIKEQPLDTEGRVREYRYRITGLGREFLMRLEKSSPELTAIRKSIDPFIGMPRSELVDFVYSQYPDSVK